MLSKSKHTLKDSGLFLFSKDKEVLISIENSILVTFRSPSSSSIGVILHDRIEPRSELIRKLNTLFEKYSSLPDVDPNLIRAKIFGTAEKHTNSLTALKSWLNRHKVPVVATALGRSLPNEVLLICSSGKVGMQYQKEVLSDGNNFLSTGTARQRDLSNRTQSRILVLSELAVQRALVKQCVEEEPHWEAHCEGDLNLKKLSSLFEKSNWFAVLISNEIREKAELFNWLLAKAETYPKLQFRWIGNELPQEARTLKNWKLLPPLDPVLLPHFKRLLRQALADYQFSETSETLPFPKKKSR